MQIEREKDKLECTTRTLTRSAMRSGDPLKRQLCFHLTLSNVQSCQRFPSNSLSLMSSASFTNCAITKNAIWANRTGIADDSKKNCTKSEEKLKFLLRSTQIYVFACCRSQQKVNHTKTLWCCAARFSGAHRAKKCSSMSVSVFFAPRLTTVVVVVDDLFLGPSEKNYFLLIEKHKKYEFVCFVSAKEKRKVTQGKKSREFVKESHS